MSTGAEGGGGAGDTYRGGFLFTDRFVRDGAVETQITAYFYEWYYPPGWTSSSSCTELVRGECRVRSCEPSEPPNLFDDEARPVETYPLAGPITVSGPGFSVVLPEPTANELNASDGYYELEGMTPTWGLGDALTFKSSGNEVPAFDFSVVVPLAPVVIEPATFTGLVIPRTDPFLARWAGANDPGTVVLILGKVQCTAPIAAGEILVHPDLLATLAPSNDTPLVLFAGKTTATTVLDWSLYATTYTDLPMADPTEFSAALVTIE